MTKRIQLTRGLFATVDDEWYEMLSLVPWCAAPTGRNSYAKRSVVRGGKVTTELMHRMIADPPLGMEVDHVDGDTLNNHVSNLRVCSPEENRRNKRRRLSPKLNDGKFKGTTWCKATQSWRAQFSLNGKMIHLGRFSTEIEAARAYNKAARDHYGVFAKLNDLPICD